MLSCLVHPFTERFGEDSGWTDRLHRRRVRGCRCRQGRYARIAPMPAHTAVATLHTTMGDIVVNLLGDHAPKTVANFLGLATGAKEWTHPATGKVSHDPLYNGVIFHRIIK